MTISGSCFQFLTPSGCNSSHYGGIIPDPVELGVSYPVIDGKKVEVTATSGSLEYLIVHPEDFPKTADERVRRASQDKK